MLDRATYMRRCFELARLAGSATSPNPRVGAVLVADDKILSEGYHQRFGGAHAEVIALNKVASKDLHLLTRATLFVSLEPCNFQGKTPPCTELIIKHRIAKVVVSCQDPNPKVAGKGIAQLRNAGIEVETGLLAAEGRALLNGFWYGQLYQRPKVLLKFAQSADGFMGREDRQVWLTNPYSRRLVHQWRSEVDAILVGTNTVAVDDPVLNTRFHFGQSPLRVVLDRKLRLSPSAKVFNGKEKTLLVTEADNAASKGFVHPSLKVWQTTFDASFIERLLRHLYEKENCCHLLVEGGARILQSFIDRGHWEEARIFRSSKHLETGIVAPEVAKAFLDQQLQIFEDQLFIYKKTKI